ncbi:MAG: division/cell wall cluster transcriptional repressor MraZ [Rhodocyclaceae bacterium]|nr:division/cell wall cluster transcriptional repressor MraZ [Rhodocyclaceae bacterium]
MFHGSAALNLDAKGRMTIPARHRDALAGPGNGRLIITSHPHQCLLLFPEAAWEATRNVLLAASGIEPRAANMRRMMLGMADEAEIDAAGRVLIGPVLRDFAKLEKEIYLVGLGDHFEIWSAQGWMAELQKFASSGSEPPPQGLEHLPL